MIANALFDRIRSGELTGQLPSDKKVAEDFGVALMTATRALTLLQERGAVVRIPRKGTFVLAGDARELTVSCLPRFFEIFRKWMQIHHPEITLKHQPPRSGYSGDLRVMTTYSIFTSYDVEISQFSRLREERLRQSGRFWDKLCDLYHKDNRLYGVPYLFSPVLLHYNRSLMREIAPDFDPVALDWDTFTGILEKAVDAGFNGIDLLLEDKIEQAVAALADSAEISKVTAGVLVSNGYLTVNDLLDADSNEIMNLPGVDADELQSALDKLNDR